MNASIGSKRWAIAEGYIPPVSTGPGRALTSHETACLLNAGETDAAVFPAQQPAEAALGVHSRQSMEPDLEIRAEVWQSAI